MIPVNYNPLKTAIARAYAVSVPTTSHILFSVHSSSVSHHMRNHATAADRYYTTGELRRISASSSYTTHMLSSLPLVVSHSTVDPRLILPRPGPEVVYAID